MFEEQLIQLFQGNLLLVENQMDIDDEMLEEYYEDYDEMEYYDEMDDYD